MTYSQILQQQRVWAATHKIAVAQGGYTKILNDNLFQPLHPETEADFRQGSGDELGGNGRPGKMQALPSSSALAVNIFDYWRERPLAWLADVLSLGSHPSYLGFERQFPTGLRGTPPNLDLAFGFGDQRTLAVESKFTETYCRHINHLEPFNRSYFPTGLGLWCKLSLPRCQRLAEHLHRGEIEFQYLNAEQLLKHVLGLWHSSGGRSTLLYLWHDIPSDEARQHRAEVKVFSDEIDSEVDFRVLTYQEFFASMLRVLGAEHSVYLQYLGQRYFPEQTSIVTTQIENLSETC